MAESGTEPLNDSTKPVCGKCGLGVDAHRILTTPPSNAVLADFRYPWHGLYCLTEEPDVGPGRLGALPPDHRNGDRRPRPPIPRPPPEATMTEPRTEPLFNVPRKDSTGEERMAAALKPFGWTCGPEFWQRYYSDPWVFNLANAVESQHSILARVWATWASSREVEQ